MYRITLTIIDRNTNNVEFRTGEFSSRGCNTFVAVYRSNNSSKGFYKQFLCVVTTFNSDTNGYTTVSRTLTYDAKDVMVESFCKECIGISNLAQYK